MASCVFCRSSGPQSREHLWPAWLRSLLRDKKLVARHRRTSTIEESADHEWEMPPFTLTVKGICRACNNGWMSEFEAHVKPLLTPLILGQPAQLDAPAQKLLALWATKTAMVYQLTTKHVAIRPHQFAYLHDHRQPPPSVQVWFASRTSEQPLPSVFGYRASGMAPAAETTSRHHGFLITLAIAHFVVQVYGNDLPFDSPWTRRGPLAPGLQQIWPLADAVVDWPPAHIFNSFEPLAEDQAFEQELTDSLAARGINLVLRPDE